MSWPEQCDQILSDFEDALKRDSQPNHKDFIAQAPSTKQAKVRCELLDMAWDRFSKQWRGGAEARIGHYFIGVPNNRRDEFFRRLVSKGQLTDFQIPRILADNSHQLIVDQKYEIRDEIGSGGMARIFKVRNRSLGDTDYAMKMIRDQESANKQTIDRFLQEAKLAAKLSKHPNIVTTTDAGKDEGKPYVVMEYIKGSDLYAVVKDRGALSAKVAVDYTIQAAKGLSAAHKKNIIHRDVKPSNLMLEDIDDEAPIVKVCDLGLAFQSDANEGDRLTRCGEVFGTPSYMSPEQILDASTVDCRTDIFSLGYTLLHLLNGQSIRKVESTNNSNQPYKPEIPESVPEQLKSTLAKMVSFSKEDRQESMKQVIRELEHCFDVVDFKMRCPVSRSHETLEFEDEGEYICDLCEGSIHYENGAATHVPALRFKCPETQDYERVPSNVSDTEEVWPCPSCGERVLVRRWKKYLDLYHFVPVDRIGFYGFRVLSFECPRTFKKCRAEMQQNEVGDYQNCQECDDELVVFCDDGLWGVCHQIHYCEFPVQPIQRVE